MLLANRLVGRAERAGASCRSRWRCQQHVKAEGLQSSDILALHALGLEVVKIGGSPVLMSPVLMSPVLRGHLVAQQVGAADEQTVSDGQHGPWCGASARDAVRERMQ